MERQRLAQRTTRDGRCVGIQATLATGSDGGGLDLYAVLDGMVGHETTDQEALFADDPARELWATLGKMIEQKLGFPLEPELFSNMLFVAALGRVADEAVRKQVASLLDTFRDTDVRGLYHFFLSLRFAGDIDCTGVAARARLVSGDIDPGTAAGRAALREVTTTILASAATRTVASSENSTHGKENGDLRRNVFKVYLDDHDRQGPECDRGLKNNPVVTANALFAPLLELKLGLRSPDEVIELKEYVEGEDTPRTASATVAEILTANVLYAIGYLLSGDWRRGCRYYASPDAFLCFLSESIREFPELFDEFGASEAIRAAIEERRHTEGGDVAENPMTSLNVAWRAIAAANVGLDATPELDRLVARQHEDGSWHDPDSLYTFGSNTSITMHFRSTVVTAGFAIRALSQPAERLTQISSSAWARPLIDGVATAVAAL
ncbi:MAG: hypothetical protein HOV80_25070 [Polyangiaceae bacterium]|nr:hypothetical protein [Polyangiaceae bacterium]